MDSELRQEALGRNEQDGSDATPGPPAHQASDHARGDGNAPFLIDITSWPCVTYAFSHNRVPVIRELRLGLPNGGASGLVKIDVSMSWSRESKPPAKPVSLTVECPAPGDEPLRIGDIGLKLDDTVLVDLEESVPATVQVTATPAVGPAQQAEHELRILARNQWFLRKDYPELLAAYVQPNHPATKDVLKRAAKILLESTGSSSIEGYQAGPERAVEIGRAIFEALQGYGLSYVNPPASFSEGQKIRPLDEVLESQAGTCVDLACAYASCLEQAGLHPLVWMVDGHAFGGFLTEDAELNGVVEQDVNVILNLVDADLAYPIETVALTNGASFAEARNQTRARLTPQGIRFLIDIYRSHRSGTLPLPARTVREGVITLVIDPGPGSAPVVERREQATGKRLQDSVPPRVARWKSSLLDLSLRNPLLNFSTKRSGLELLVPKGKLGVLEDDLHHGKAITIQPGDKLEGPEAAAGLRFITEVAAGVLGDRYDNFKLVYTPVDDKEGRKRTRALIAKARLQESETGANNLYLALGTLVWRVKEKEVTSPLFLIPVRMNRPRGASLFNITVDETGFSAPNYCLAEKLKAEFNLHLPFFEQPEDDGAGIDIDKGIASLRKALLERGLNFRVDESAHLAVLQFSKFRLWKDMDEHWQSFLDNPVVKHLVETPGERFEDPAGALLEIDVGEAETKTFCPVPVDGTQLRAVVRGAASHSFVLEGPPGTGKSQTITNLLAHALATNKTVLFVAEKQAALSVVKDRLHAVGLDPYCLDLHDKGSKPEQIRSQLREALDHRPEVDRLRVEETERTLSSLHDRLAYFREQLYRENAFQLSYATAHERLLEMGEGPGAAVPRSLFERKPEEINALRTALLDIAPAIIATKPRRHHPWRFSLIEEFGTVDRKALGEAVRAVSAARNALMKTEGPLGELLDSLQTPKDLKQAVLLVESVSTAAVPSSANLDRVTQPEWQEEFNASFGYACEVVDKARSVSKDYGQKVFARPVGAFEEAQAELERAAKSFFLVRRGRIRTALRTLLSREEVPRLRPREAVALGADLLRARKDLAEVAVRLASVGGVDIAETFRPETPGALDELRLEASRTSKIAQLLAQAGDAGSKARAYLASGTVPPPGIASALRELSRTLDPMFERAAAGAEHLHAWLEGRGLMRALDETLADWLADAEDDRFLSLQRWAALRQGLHPVRGAGLEAFADDILDGKVPGNEADEIFRRGLLRAAVRERSEAAQLDTFDRVAHEQVIDRYIELAATRRELLQDAIPTRLSESRSFNSDSRYGEVNELRSELQRKRGVKSIRQLIAKFPQLVQRLTPCFLMSPFSVAQFIPAGSLTFDIVVFDEASQIDVAEAVGAMGRARSVIIVGDSKQMPPTRVFDSALGGDEQMFATPEDEDELPEDGESLLIEAVETGMDQEWLAWHYRSQDESLIAFSNAHYYEGRLSSFPNPRASGGAALSWHRVAGQFEHGKERINRVEAEAVTAEVIRRTSDPETASESLCVVTLNRQQQQEIIRLLEASGDARVRDLLDSEDDDSILVRNLENVQGHERDVVIISTGFSKKPNGGPLPLNFGPLNRAGGERRLNVAVTRARREVVVYSSFEPEEIEDHRTSSLGLLHLREFLMMAKYGVKPPEATEANSELLKAHRDDVQRALEGRGLKVGLDVGLSPFRVDLAVTLEGHDHWHVAVLLDGSRWSRRETVGDRDALPVTVLKNLMGWPRVARVWLPSWRTERAAVVEEIAALTEQAVREAEERAKDADNRKEEVPAFDPAARSGEPTERKDAPPGQHHPSDDPASAVTGLTQRSATTGSFADAASGPAARERQVEDEYEGLVRFVPYAAEPQVGSPEECSPERISSRVQWILREAVEQEGPVEIRRLAKLVSARFGVARLYEKRAQAIIRTVPRGWVRKGAFGSYVWPEAIDPDSYEDFRISPDESTRSIEEIAPEELANAMRHIAGQAMTIDRDELIRVTAGLFGIKRITGNIESVLLHAISAAVASGKLAESDGRLRVA